MKVTVAPGTVAKADVDIDPWVIGIGARYSYIWADTATDKTKSATFSGIPVKDKGHVGDFTAGTLFISGNLAF